MIISIYADEYRASPNCNPRNGIVDAITPHHTGGAYPTIEGIDARFMHYDPKNGASANYVIFPDGYCICYVPEDYRAWTSGSAENDYRAVTFELANITEDPDWVVSDAAMEKFYLVATDVCKRWGFKLNYTGDKDGSLTMHKMFQSTMCPGPYIEERMVLIEQTINRRIEEGEGEKMTREEKEMMVRMECNEWLHHDPDYKTLNDMCELIPDDAEYGSFNTSAMDDMLEHSEEGNHVHRIEAIKAFYRSCLGREASDQEAYGWSQSEDASLRAIYRNIYNSDEAQAYRNRKFTV